MNLKEARKEIRHIDEKMAELFEKRMEFVTEVAKYKKKTGLDIDDPEQERHIIDECSVLIENDELRPYYSQFLQETMNVSKRWQHRLLEGQKIACCGDAGSLDYAAASSIFPDGIIESYDRYEDAFRAAEDGKADVVVMPFENGYGDEIASVMDLIFAGNLHVNAVYDIIIDPNAWGEKRSVNEEIRRYVALSTVENKPENKQDTGAFLLMFTVKDEAGGLAKAINTISVFNYNMRVLRSRPLKDHQWHYYFYAEALGNDTSDNGKRMLNALRVACADVKVAGRYSAGRKEIRIKGPDNK